MESLPRWQVQPLLVEWVKSALYHEGYTFDDGHRTQRPVPATSAVSPMHIFAQQKALYRRRSVALT